MAEVRLENVSKTYGDSKMYRPRPVREGETSTFDVNLAETKLFDRATGRAM